MLVRADSVIAAASVVTAIGVAFLWWQARLLRIQINADHERSRRQLAVSLIQHWNASTSPVVVAAERVVNRLDEEQCRSLTRMNPFSVTEDLMPLLETCLAEVLSAGEKLSPSNGCVQLTQKHVTRLRFLMTDYLNETEAVLLAWLMGVADKKAIEDEFAFICNAQHGYSAVERFRTTMGVDNWPAIKKFLEEMRNKGLSGPNARPELPL